MDEHRRRRRFIEEDIQGSIEDIDDDVPIDILENTRDRTAREHISDEAVGKEIERR